MPFDNGTSEQITSETVSHAFYAYLGKQVNWEAFQRVRSLWFDGGCPA